MYESEGEDAMMLRSSVLLAVLTASSCGDGENCTARAKLDTSKISVCYYNSSDGGYVLVTGDGGATDSDVLVGAALTSDVTDGVGKVFTSSETFSNPDGSFYLHLPNGELGDPVEVYAHGYPDCAHVTTVVTQVEFCER